MIKWNKDWNKARRKYDRIIHTDDGGDPITPLVGSHVVLVTSDKLQVQKVTNYS